MSYYEEILVLLMEDEEEAVEHAQMQHWASAKINISYSILFNLTTSYSSYFEGKKGISRNKTCFFLLMGMSELVQG